MKTYKVKLSHGCAVPGSVWCIPIGWEPTNIIEGAEFVDGAWWDDASEVAGIAFFSNTDEHSEGDTVEATLDDLRVIKSGSNCRVLAKVEV